MSELSQTHKIQAETPKHSTKTPNPNNPQKGQLQASTYFGGGGGGGGGWLGGPLEVVLNAKSELNEADGY